MRRKTLLYILIISQGILAASFVSTKYIWENKERTLTIDDLPRGAIFHSHPYDEKRAAETGGVAMRHYGTLKAMRGGGPIYGVLGYRIVAIEYIIRQSEIKERPIGEIFEGWRLNISDIRGPIRYDHFHIGPISASMVTEHMGKINGAEEAGYIIHFMLIPHDYEVAYNLICS